MWKWSGLLLGAIGLVCWWTQSFALQVQVQVVFEKPAAPIQQESVKLATKTGELFGTLDLPKGGGPFPVMMILAGSGPTDRDGNSPQMKMNTLKMLGEGLAGHGIACLRTDKRGIAQSSAAGPKEEDLTLNTYVEDTIDWLNWLQQQKRFQGIGLIGHSEGSLISLLVQQKREVGCFVSLCGPGEPLSKTLRTQLKRQLPENLYQQSDQILTDIAAGRWVTDPPKELYSLFRPSVQPYLRTMIQPDPTLLIAKVTRPILLVEGTADIQIPPYHGHALAAANPKAKLATIQRMAHPLKLQQPGELDLVPYLDANRPLHPQVLSTVIPFIQSILGRKS